MALIGVILAAGVVLWGLTVILTVIAMLRPARLTPARAMARLGRMTPADVGLPFFDQNFTVVDDRTREPTPIAGWWIPAAEQSSRTVLIVHGYGDSRAGALAWAPVWRSIGFHVALIDLRAHGESGGTVTSAGLIEQFDIRRIVDELRAVRPAETARFMLFGVSLGATIALAAARQTADLAGVVLESPVADFTHGAITQAWLMGLPGALVVRPGVWLAERWLGASFDTLRPAVSIAGLGCPVLAMLPANDPFLPPTHADELRRAIAGRRQADGVSQVVDFKGAAHLLAAQAFPEPYQQALQQFCDRCTDSGLARASAEGAVARQSY